MLHYSTLQEAYNIDTFERDKRIKKKKAKCDEELLKEIDEVRVQQNAGASIDPQSTFCTKIPKQPVSMKNVKPFLDEDLEQYLNVESFKNADSYKPPDIPVVPTIPTVPSIPQTDKASVPSGHSTPSVSLGPSVTHTDAKVSETSGHKVSTDDFYRNIINIGLFIFIGILIIFLCDQITEIAINLGMKKTVAILQPYLVDLKKS